jgi:hypothetical protein
MTLTSADSNNDMVAEELLTTGDQTGVIEAAERAYWQGAVGVEHETLRRNPLPSRFSL